MQRILGLIVFISISCWTADAQLSKETNNKDIKLLEKSKRAYANQDFEKAKEFMMKCLESDGLNSQGYVYQILGDIEFAMKDFEAAIKAYNESAKNLGTEEITLAKSKIGIDRSTARISYKKEIADRKRKKTEREENRKSKGQDTVMSTGASFSLIEQVPIYPGCEAGLSNKEHKSCMQSKITEHVSQIFQTSMASVAGIGGTVKISTEFKIDKEGNIAQVHAIAVNPILEHEAIRVVKFLPQMKPGLQKGKPVNVIYGLPIIFETKR